MRKKLLVNLIVLLVIVLIYFLPRFFNLDKRIGFDWDQENLAYEVKKIVVNHKLTLLGPRVNNDKGFFLGPYFTYILTPFYLLSNLHPNANLYFIVFYNLTFFSVTYLILNALFGKKFTYLFLTVWSFNNLFVEYDVIPWWPLLMPLGVIAVIYSLHLIYRDKIVKGLIFFGLVNGFFLNLHVQFIFVLLYGVIFILALWYKRKFNPVQLFVPFVFLMLLFLPLIFFDLRHSFFNSQLFYHFFTDKDPHATPYMFAWIPVFTNAMHPYLGFRESICIGWIAYFGMFGLFIYQFFRSKNFLRFHYFASILLWSSILLVFSLYGKRPSEYYFNFMHPFIYIAIIDFLLQFKYRTVLPFILGFYIAFNLPAMKIKISPPGISLFAKDKTIQYIKRNVKDKKCDIAFNVPLGRRFGFDYLIDYYGIEKKGDWKSCVVNINIPSRTKDKIFGDIGVKLPGDK